MAPPAQASKKLNGKHAVSVRKCWGLGEKSIKTSINIDVVYQGQFKHCFFVLFSLHLKSFFFNLYEVPFLLFLILIEAGDKRKCG